MQGQAGDPHRGLGHARPAGGDRGREAAQAQRQEGDRGVRRRGVQRACRESVFTLQGRLGGAVDRIGYWLDYEHPYITYSNEYIESVWWLLQRLHEKDLLYRGHRVLPYCPRCGTVLSSHELALGYEEIQDKSVYVTFPLDDGSRPRAGGLDHDAVDAALERGGRRCIRISSTASTPSRRAGAGGSSPRPARAGRGCSAKARSPSGRCATFPGRELVGLRYRRPLDVVPLPDGRAARRRGRRRLRDRRGRLRASCTWRRRSAPTTTRPGSEHGLALRAPGGGRRHLQRHHLARDRGQAGHRRRDQRAHHPPAQGTTGRHLRDRAVRAHLSALLALREQLIYYARDSWFVRTSAVKDRMLALNAQVQLASARGRDGPLRRVAGEQRRLGALARPLLGHAAPGLGLRPRPGARRGDRQLRRAGRSGGARRCRPTSIRTSRSSTSYTWACAGRRHDAPRRPR